ncbi:uncharacterized protein Hap1MRO34_002450 [Clarias gariepinus]
MENITTLSCTNISAGFGFTYMVLPYMLSVLRHDEDCEQAWYDEELKCLSDGHKIWNTTGLVVGVTSESITLSECIKLYCNVNCDGSGQKLRHIYQVTKEDVQEHKNSNSGTTATGVLTEVLILVLIGHLLLYTQK